MKFCYKTIENKHMVRNLNNIKVHLTFPSYSLNPICAANRVLTFPEFFQVVYFKECFASPNKQNQI